LELDIKPPPGCAGLEALAAAGDLEADDERGAVFRVRLGELVLLAALSALHSST